MIATILGFAKTALGGIWGYVAALGVGAAAAGFLAWRICSWDYGAQIANLEKNDATFATKQVQQAKDSQARQDKIALDAAVAEATGQVQIIHQIDTIETGIPNHVSDSAHCITFGLVRVLNAAALSADPNSLGIATGQSDDACAPISWRAFATDLVDDYGLGNQNAEQLNALIAFERAREGAE